jgi:hypothetical protein
MTHPSAFQIVLPSRRAIAGRRAATFAAKRFARRSRGAWGPDDRGVDGGRGCRKAARCRLHKAAGRDGARVAA